MNQTTSPDRARQQEALLLAIAQDLARELTLRPRHGQRNPLDLSLKRDWDFDSLSRAERLFRIKRASEAHFSSQPLQKVGDRFAWRLRHCHAARAAGGAAGPARHTVRAARRPMVAATP